jgi:glycosyltransferase involved in cell wall biosynthesis
MIALNELISVIVPVFKVEAYLAKCIESIRCQTYPNFELILVDDGSPDGSPQICDDYAAVDDRIRVIHKNNRGLSSARNAGLDIAQGEFICFIDSDDYIKPEYLETLLTLQRKNNADLVICEYDYVEKNGNVYEHHKIPWNKSITHKDFWLLFCESDYRVFSAVAWNKIYRAKIFKEVRYTLGKCMEDNFIIKAVIEQCDSIYVTNEVLYYYLQRPDSIMGRFSIKHLDGVEAQLDICNYFNSVGWQECSQKLLGSITNSLFRAYREADFIVKFNRERYKELKKAYKEVVKQSFSSKEHNQLWFKYKVFGFNEGLYRVLYNNGLMLQIMSLRNKDQIQYH